MICPITLIDFLSIQPFMRPFFSGQQELSNLDYYFQDGRKSGAASKWLLAIAFNSLLYKCLLLFFCILFLSSLQQIVWLNRSCVSDSLAFIVAAPFSGLTLALNLL